VPPPRGDVDAPLQMLVANLDSSDYLGRIAIGRIFNGRVKIGDPVAVCKLDGRVQQTKVTKLFAFEGLRRIDITEAAAGDIVCLAGIEDITIGETIADVEHPVPIRHRGGRADGVDDLRRQHLADVGARRPVRHLAPDQGPARAGTARQRLDPGRADRHARADEGLGRGELQLSILIEMMRREGFELQVSRPDIVTKEMKAR
jgi:GTP-binding protein